MFFEAMPGRVFEMINEFELRRRIEFLFWNVKVRDGHARGKFFRPKDSRIFDRHPERIGLHLDANFKRDIFFGKRLDHIVTQIIVRRMAERQAGNLFMNLGLWVKRILHRLARPKEIRHAAIIILPERIILRLVPKRLHEKIENVGLAEIQEIKDRQLARAPGLQGCICPAVGGHEGRGADAKQILGELFFVCGDLFAVDAHELDGHAAKADVIDIGGHVRAWA
jgi:hypothetical protein